MQADDDELELTWWLVSMGQTDRELYRAIRAAAWAIYSDESSKTPSKFS